MKKNIFSIVLFSLFLSASAAQAVFFPPDTDFYTVKTDHFYIHYAKGTESVTQDFIEIAENVYDRLSKKYNWEPWGRTHVVLTDKTDMANGTATVLPTNYLLIYITPPEADSSLDNYKNYLEMLFVHEFTHILHIDQHYKMADPAHWVFGKLVAPNGLTPGWVREGIATFEESTSTGRGRGNFSFSEMMLRTSIYEENFPRLDQVAGVGIHWPSAETQYIYGAKFWQWLAQKYGEDRMHKFMKEYASGLWIFSLNNKARRVYGKSFYKLWQDWKNELTEKYEVQRVHLEKEGLTPFGLYVHHEDLLSYPTADPSGKGFAYTRTGIDESPAIVITRDSKEEPVVLKRDAVGQLSFSRDGGQYIAFSSLGFIEKYRVYADVYVYDFKKETLARVFDKENPKESLRATDPDFSSIEGGNRWLVMVRTDQGTDNLFVYDRENKKGTYLTDAPKYTQFSNPRFSPDGNQIVVSQRDHEKYRDIVLYSKKGVLIQKITNDLAIDNHPIWSPDGESIYYSSDESGIPNIYRYNLKTKRSMRVTNVLTGVYQPSLSSDGRTLYVKYFKSSTTDIYNVAVSDLGPYSSKPSLRVERGNLPNNSSKSNKGLLRSTRNDGYDYSSSTRQNLFASQTISSSPKVEQGEEEKKNKRNKKEQKEKPSVYGNSLKNKSEPSLEDIEIRGAEKYHAFPEILVPRYIMPTFMTLDDSYLLGFSTGRYDSLYRHSWSLSGSYRSDVGFLGIGASYAYLRYNPSFFVGYFRYAYNWGDLFGTGSDFVEQRNHAYVGSSYQYKKHNFSLSYFFEARDNFSAIPSGYSLPTLDNYAGVRAVYIYVDFKQYANSISREDGFYAKITFDLTDSMFGSASANEQQVVTGDFRYYFEMPWNDHHVFGLRAAGGWVWGDQELFGSFRFGGPFGEGTLAGYSSRLFPLRGLPGVTYYGDRVLLFSGEYRLPIWTIERGIGTWPIYFRQLHMSFFGDYGDSWVRNGKDGVGFFDDFFLGVGAEFKLDMVIGYGLPLTGRMGYAVIVMNRDQITGLSDPLLGTDLRYGTLYLQFGTSF